MATLLKGFIFVKLGACVRQCGGWSSRGGSVPWGCEAAPARLLHLMKSLHKGVTCYSLALHAIYTWFRSEVSQSQKNYIFEYCPTVVLYNILDHGNKYHVASTRAPLSAIYVYATKSVWIVRASFIALPYMWKGLCVLLGLLTEPANKCHTAQEHHPALRECHLLRAVYNGSECVLQHKIMM